MKIRISPLENPYVFEILDKMSIDYVKEELYLHSCIMCNKIFRNKPPKECPDCGSTEIESEQLGDIVGWYYNYIIERKKGRDLIASLQDDRIYEQIRKMTEFFGSNVAIVFEGNFEDVIKDEIIRLKTLGISNRGRIAQLYSIPATIMQYGASFIQVKDFTTLVKMLKFCDYKCGTLPKIRLHKKRLSDLLPDFVKMLISLRGISQILAVRIYVMFKNVEALIKALRSGEILKSKKVDGIGKKKVETLKKAFL